MSRRFNAGKDKLGTDLHLAGPQVRWAVAHDTAGPVSLHTADHVVAATLDTFRDDTKTMVFHDAGAADMAEETLLDTLAEPDDSDTGRRLHNKEGHLVEKRGKK